MHPLFQIALDFILPSACILCQQDLLAAEESVCHSCRAQIRWHPSYARPMGGGLEGVLTGGDLNGVLKDFLYAFKFRGQEHLANALVKDEWLGQYEIFKGIEAIIPVPASPWTDLRRGYNQAELLAQEWGKRLNRPVWNGSLRRWGFISQRSLGRSGRKKNALRSFRVRRPSVAPHYRRVLLVDDVYTTGATLTQCAGLLKTIGIQEVFGFAVARDELAPPKVS